VTPASPQVLVGAGGLGREVLAALRARRASGQGNPRTLGFVDDRRELWGQVVDGLPVLGPVSAVTDGSLEPSLVTICTGRPGNTRSRRDIDARLRRSGVGFATVVHPSTSVAEGTSVGDGSVLLAHVVATAPIVIGRHVVVMPQVVFTHDDVIGDFTTFGAGVRLAGGVAVETGAYVGAGALVREGITIGSGSLVGMGAVVTRDVPPEEVWVGNPARLLRRIDDGPGLMSEPSRADVDGPGTEGTRR
jgi:sugar O-acyltransferase (sialic acid O-acetyltransferase NeuD family)